MNTLTQYELSQLEEVMKQVKEMQAYLKQYDEPEELDFNDK